MRYSPTIAFLCCILFFSTAKASLGDDGRSVVAEAKALSANHTTRQSEQYQVHVLKLPTTTIKEFISDKDVVFAITWSGTKKPNLSKFLGSHFDEYFKERSKQRHPKGRHFYTVKTAKLFVQGGGHMRALHGIAYLPAAVPAGVDVENLQ